MIKEINMPMMAPDELNGSSSGLTWDDIPSAGPADVQSGRVVYIDVDTIGSDEDPVFVTRMSAGKIIQFLREGFLPVLKLPLIAEQGDAFELGSATFTYEIPHLTSIGESVSVLVPSQVFDIPLFAYSDALDKPFISIDRNNSDPEGGTT